MPSKCGVLVGGLALAHASAVRQSASSAVHAVELVGELLQTQNMGSEVLFQQLSEIARSSVTPGAEDSFKTSLQAVVGEIEGIEAKIKAGHGKAQAKIGTLFSGLDEANTAATTAHQTAEKNDKVWFECVAGEQTKRQDVEAKDAVLTTSRSNQEEACQLQQDNREFGFDAKGKYNLKFACDHIKGNCRAQLENWRDSILEQMFQDGNDALTASATHHTGLKNDCETKKEVQVQAQSALDSAEGEWIKQRKTCSSRNSLRTQAICDFGTKSQAKCAAEGTFGEFIAATEQAKGGADSEVDRQSEWTALGTAKCMVKAIIGKGLGASLGSEELTACAGSINYADVVGTLDPKAADSAKLKKMNMCAARDVSFFNGQTWKVPPGVEPQASAYTREAFTPNIDPSSGNFAFCA